MTPIIARTQGTGEASKGDSMSGTSDRSQARPAFRLALALLGLVDVAKAGPPPIAFREVGAGSGVHFRFTNGTRGRHDLPEIMGGGVALFDGDGDGDLDLFFADGGPIAPRNGGDDPPCRYYRNRGNGTFEDATAEAGCPGPSYATGTAAGDYDGDGRDDLFVSGWRGQRLYRNVGGGRFEDVTARAGVAAADLWGTSAAWADLDGDGDLDLFVAAYLDFDPESAPFCAAPDGRRDYCGPEDFPAQPDRLYRNNGDGTFTDVARAAGVDDPNGRGLGVLVADLNGDARPDLYVANDGSACRLFENLGGMRFREAGGASGVAFDGRGQALAGMGVASGDLDGDGRPELAVGNFYGRSTAAFRALGGGMYEDASGPLGLNAATRSVLGFGLVLADFDADGALDLAQANGHVLDRSRLGVPFAMPTTLLRNVGGKLVDASRGAGPWFARPVLGRGLAAGDFDGDGRPDLVLSAIDAPAALLRNESPGRPVVLDLIGKRGRNPAGTRVRAKAGGLTLVRDVTGGGSYLSASDRRVYLGLGAAPKLDRLEVTWPWGATERWDGLPASGVLRVVEGTGRPVERNR